MQQPCTNSPLGTASRTHSRSLADAETHTHTQRDTQSQNGTLTTPHHNLSYTNNNNSSSVASSAGIVITDSTAERSNAPRSTGQHSSAQDAAATARKGMAGSSVLAASPTGRPEGSVDVASEWRFQARQCLLAVLFLSSCRDGAHAGSVNTNGATRSCHGAIVTPSKGARPCLPASGGGGAATATMLCLTTVRAWRPCGDAVAMLVIFTVPASCCSPASNVSPHRRLDHRR